MQQDKHQLPREFCFPPTYTITSCFDCFYISLVLVISSGLLDGRFSVSVENLRKMHWSKVFYEWRISTFKTVWPQNRLSMIAWRPTPFHIADVPPTLHLNNLFKYFICGITALSSIFPKLSAFERSTFSELLMIIYSETVNLPSSSWKIQKISLILNYSRRVLSISQDNAS